MSTDSTDWIPQAGDLVVVRDPNDFVADLRNKIRNGRVGEVRSVNGERLYVLFPAEGRRKEIRHTFNVRHLERAPRPAS